MPKRENFDPTVTDYTKAPGPGAYDEQNGFSLEKYEKYKEVYK